MSLFQALLIGIFAYLGRNQVPWLFGTTGGFYCVGRPLVAGFIVGLILGDVTTGILCGVAIQAMYIGQIVPGGAMPSDVNYASYIGIPLAMAAGGGAEAAIALAIPLGALGTAMHNFTMTLNSIWVHRGDKCAAKGDVKGIMISNLCGTIPHLIERVTIVAIACYFGAPAAEAILNALPEIVLRFLQVGGKMLPALGFALLLKQIVAEKWMIIIFIFGWIIMQSTGMTTTALTLVSVAVALMFVMAKYGNSGATNKEEMQGDDGYDE